MRKAQCNFEMVKYQRKISTRNILIVVGVFQFLYIFRTECDNRLSLAVSTTESPPHVTAVTDEIPQYESDIDTNNLVKQNEKQNRVRPGDLPRQMHEKEMAASGQRSITRPRQIWSNRKRKRSKRSVFVHLKSQNRNISDVEIRVPGRIPKFEKFRMKRE